MKLETCIVTPTYNQEDFTIRCFDSIRRNTGVPYKIIWIDNGSTPKSREKVKKFLEENKIPYEAILNEKNLGFVKATNQGMKKALELGTPYIVLQNNDTEVYEGWLERMIEVAESDPHIGIVGPITSPCKSWQSIINLQIKVPTFSNLPEYNNNSEEYAKKIERLYQKEEMEVKHMVAFFCTLIKSELVRQVGLLSEEYGTGFADDDDYCYRARQSNWKIMLAMDVFVFHNHRTTFKSRFNEEEIKEMIMKNVTLFRSKCNNEEDRSGKVFKFWKVINRYNKLKCFDRHYFFSLFRKAYWVLHQQGLKTFLRYTWKYLIYGRKYFR
ncbi:MAG: glycosyltransferase family 2 protein [Candidatus Moranbacteria bacterium]|nr:glycosyltransferase family 2 protein [Candidatus Moranbacteria bacterium]